MHILRLTPHLYRQGSWPVAYDPVGGLQNQVWRLTEELGNNGVRQTVCTSRIPGYPRKVKHSDNLVVVSLGLPLPRLFASTLLGATWFFGVLIHLLKNKSSYSLVHIHYNHWLWCRLLAGICKGLGVPTVISLNTDLWVSFREEGVWAKLTSNLASLVERWTINICDAVIALTEEQAYRWRLEVKLDPSKITVIGDSINPKIFEGKTARHSLMDFCERYNVPRDRKIVSYIGRIRQEKGWEDLPIIADRLKSNDGFLLICGDGPDRPILEAALSERNCSDAVSITGFIEPEQIKIALHISDLLILPSRREAFGSVLLEAMAAKVPAIAYGVGGIKELAGFPQAIHLVEPGNRTKLIGAIEYLLEDVGQQQEMKKRGLRRVGNYLLINAMNDTLQVYQKLLSVQRGKVLLQWSFTLPFRQPKQNKGRIEK